MNLNSNSYFSTLPSVDIERSKFKRPSSLKTTFNAGDLVPIFLDMDVLPGDTYSLDMSSLVRMSTPIFPVMDNAFLDIFFFFVPNRLVWKHWREFMGENRDSYWTQSTEYTVPQLDVSDTPFKKGSLGDYFGLPTEVSNISVNALPFRAYSLIWNEFFRDQNTMDPSYFRDDDSDVIKEVDRDNLSTSRGTFSERLQYVLQGVTLLPCSKYHDYFTSCLPQPQKGSAVDLSLTSSNVPVVTLEYGHPQDASYPLTFESWQSMEPGTSYNLFTKPFESGPALYGENVGLTAGGVGFYPNNLYTTDFQVQASINDIRTAFQLQKLLEKDARGGTRYRELIKMHFGVDNMDARMQIPEYLGGKRIPINVDQVLQTSSTNEVSPQGNTAAYSLTSDVSSTFTKSFTEHGMIIGLACVRTDHTYQQGIERGWSRKTRFDYYWPSLAHISEQAVLVKEIYANGNEFDDDAFGYQEAFAEYRYRPSRVTGAFRSNYNGSLDSWHYADFYYGGNDSFVLSAPWLEETPNNIDRTLAVSSSVEDQFLADFYFDLDCVRPMPLYGVPGLVDHF